MKQAREMRCIGARRACPPSLNVKYQEALDTIKQIIAIMTTHLISIELFLLSAKLPLSEAATSLRSYEASRQNYNTSILLSLY